MKSCGKCSLLERKLREASEYYVSLILQQHQLIREGTPDESGLEQLVQEAHGKRDSAAADLLAHRKTHDRSASASPR